MAPTGLVTTGPYKRVRHPIYLSYILLFNAFAMLLHSAPTAIALTLCCALHYSHRTRLESEVGRAPRQAHGAIRCALRGTSAMCARSPLPFPPPARDPGAQVLHAKFGPAYTQWASQTKQWIPGLV